jgi:hypothetical protein
MGRNRRGGVGGKNRVYPTVHIKTALTFLLTVLTRPPLPAETHKAAPASSGATAVLSLENIRGGEKSPSVVHRQAELERAVKTVMDNITQKTTNNLVLRWSPLDAATNHFNR